MIALFTDFGWQGPYIGQLKAMLLSQAPDRPLVDLMHDAPCFNARASAYLLAALTPYLVEDAIIVGVVDPGVGSKQRRPLIMKAGGRYYVGPDNGLFSVVAQRATQVSCWEILWRPSVLSNSFHGRDLFVPVAAMLANDNLPNAAAFPAGALVGADWPMQLDEIIYIDHYGNCMTGRSAAGVEKTVMLEIAGQRLAYAPTFAAVARGEAFWYENSNGLIEIAVNTGSAAELLSLSVADSFRLT